MTQNEQLKVIVADMFVCVEDFSPEIMSDADKKAVRIFLVMFMSENKVLTDD